MKSPDNDFPIPGAQQIANKAPNLAKELIENHLDLSLPNESSQDNSRKWVIFENSHKGIHLWTMVRTVVLVIFWLFVFLLSLFKSPSSETAENKIPSDEKFN